MNYIGEHLLPGQIGRIFIVLNFLAAALAAISYYFAESSSLESWKKMGRYAFSVHGLSVIGYAACMFT